MSDSSTWYADNMFCLTYWQLMKLSWTQGLIGVLLVFPFFAFRKLVRWQFVPTSAQLRPAELQVLSPNDLPADVRAAVAPLVGAAVNAGLELALCHRKPVIGDKREYVIFLAEPTGRLGVEIIWTWQRVGQTENATTVFTCGSRLTGDREINTVANALAQVLRGILPAWVEIQFLPEGTPPEMVIAAHRQAIADRNDVVAVAPSEWTAQYLRSTQRGFDHLISVQMLIPISPAEAARLRTVNVEPIVRAELVR